MVVGVVCSFQRMYLPFGHSQQENPIRKSRPSKNDCVFMDTWVVEWASPCSDIGWEDTASDVVSFALLFVSFQSIDIRVGRTESARYSNIGLDHRDVVSTSNQGCDDDNGEWRR